MEENLEPKNDQDEVVDNTTDYIDQIKQLKENSVSKDAYERIVNENKKLIKSLSDRNTNESAPVAPKKDLNELRNKIASGNLNNMEYVQTMVDIRDAALEANQRDPFCSFGTKPIKKKEKAVAQETYDYYKSILEQANGDPDLFTTLFYKGLVEE